MAARVLLPRRGPVADSYCEQVVELVYLLHRYPEDSTRPPWIRFRPVHLGFGGREYTVSVGVTRKLAANWLGSAKLGYIESRNDTSGGNTNFRGPLGYVSMQRAF